MEDISLVIVKPEIIESVDAVCASLNRRGFTVSNKRRFRGWKKFVQHFYKEFSSQEIETYFLGYLFNKMDENPYEGIIVTHPLGNTISLLNAQKGHFRDYQDGADDVSLRAEFGLGKGYNISLNGTTFSYNGIHCPASSEELNANLEFLRR